MTDSKPVYKSVFAAELSIDLPNVIVEQVMLNFINRWKYPRVNFPFWRAEYKDREPKLKVLGERYTLELTSIKNLLMVFKPEVLLNVIRTDKITSVGYMKKEDRLPFIYKLYMTEVNYKKRKMALTETMEMALDSVESPKKIKQPKKVNKLLI